MEVRNPLIVSSDFEEVIESLFTAVAKSTALRKLPTRRRGPIFSSARLSTPHKRQWPPL
jgi:hypothetical protein